MNGSFLRTMNKRNVSLTSYERTKWKKSNVPISNPRPALHHPADPVRIFPILEASLPINLTASQSERLFWVSHNCIYSFIKVRFWQKNIRKKNDCQRNFKWPFMQINGNAHWNLHLIKNVEDNIVFLKRDSSLLLISKECASLVRREMQIKKQFKETDTITISNSYVIRQSLQATATACTLVKLTKSLSFFNLE